MWSVTEGIAILSIGSGPFISVYLVFLYLSFVILEWYFQNVIDWIGLHGMLNSDLVLILARLTTAQCSEKNVS